MRDCLSFVSINLWNYQKRYVIRLQAVAASPAAASGEMLVLGERGPVGGSQQDEPREGSGDKFFRSLALGRGVGGVLCNGGGDDDR